MATNNSDGYQESARSFPATLDAVKYRSVDIVVPVYKGLDVTARCLESVIATAPDFAEIIVINDASPDPQLCDYVDRLAAEGKIRLVRNESNQGFVASVNQGMSLHADRDVILLNSDTQVPRGWVERLQNCARRADDVATVTPFSNNATICSYPRFVEDNVLGDEWPLERLDAVFREYNRGRVTLLPTAVGFCMYIRRECLDEIGLFDLRFGLGYGEENDFSRRAVKAGWKNLLCGDLFVYHEGSVSFGESKNELTQTAARILRSRHPEYDRHVQTHVNRDPAKPMRLAVDFVRLAESEKTKVLCVSHGRGGGTQKHIDDLAELLDDRVTFVMLSNNEDSTGELAWLHPNEGMKLPLRFPDDYPALIETLKQFNFSRIHLHHTLGMPEQLWEKLQSLELPYDVTLHDYHSCCPELTSKLYEGDFCGMRNTEGCGDCLKAKSSEKVRQALQWREWHQRIFEGAERIFVPSLAAKRRINRAFPGLELTAAPHPESQPKDGWPPVQTRKLALNEPLRIAVLGALGPPKGADLLEECAMLAEEQKLPLEFHLIGYAYRPLREFPSAPLLVHGKYSDDELPQRLRDLDPHIIWFPAQWPETYSYTLSEAFANGFPVASTDIGALGERLHGREWSWLLPYDASAHTWNDLFVRIRDKHLPEGNAPQPPVSREVGLDQSYAQFDYASDYIVNENSTAAAEPWAPARVRLLVVRLLKDKPQEARTGWRLRLVDALAHVQQNPWIWSISSKVPDSWKQRIKKRILRAA